MRYIKKSRIGIGYGTLLKIHKSKGCYADTKDDNSKSPKITTRTDILSDLLDEQGHICAYCMRRISSEDAGIEHIIGQNYIDENNRNVGKEEDTNYNNMLAVCHGKFCLNETHCDSSRSKYQKKEPLLEISPLNKLQMNNIKFTQSGKIYYSELDAKTSMNDNLSRILNLNCNGIVEDRFKIGKSVRSLLRRHKYDKKFAKKELERWESKNTQYKPFCQVAIFELRKYI